MTAILGVSAFYHDSAAALVVDGEIVAAAQEERFSREKHDAGFPQRAIDYCLAEAGIEASALDYVGFYDKPYLKFERLLETYLGYAPRGFVSYRKAMPIWLRQKLHLQRELNRGLRGQYRNRYVFTHHHQAHAASAFLPSPFEEAAILTMDGVGEWATASWGVGRGNRIELRSQLRFPHSLGLLYSAFTYYTGFRVNSDEYKLMGLAPYGEPRFADRILGTLIDLKDDGSFRLDMSYFDYCQGLTMTGPRFEQLFGAPRRPPGEPITQHEMDVAASVQRVTEEIVLRCARHVAARTGMRQLCLAGGVALNCVANGRLLREGPFDALWVQPAADDAGGALGVALFVWHQLLGAPRHPIEPDGQHGSLLGSRYSDEQVRSFLDAAGAVYRELPDLDTTCEEVAGLLDRGQVVGWFQDRMEFGPRALGSRSILGDPRRAEMQALINRKVKFREGFRPFAPAVLAEAAHDFFELEAGTESPYMTLVAPVRESRRHALSDEDRRRTGIDKLRVERSEIPAVTHVDDSARIQTVDAERHPAFRRLLASFERRTGCPVLVNTSFNLGWDPIVESPRDAYETFMRSEIDALAIGRCLLEKRAQPAVAAEPVGPGDDFLTELLRSPCCGEPVAPNRAHWVCRACGHEFTREDGIARCYWPHGGVDDPGDVTERVKAFYEETPFPNYEEHDSLRSLIEKSRDRIYARRLDEAVPLNSTVLEVGCGTGQLSNFLGIACRRVVATDLCLNSLRLGETFRREHELSRVRFVQMNLFRPCLASAQFDVVLCNGVLHHTSDPFGGFARLVPLLRPGGIFVLGLYNRYGRLATDLRRALFRLTGGRGRWLDPVLRKTARGAEKQRAWFADQYRHPHESKHTMGEVLRWFERTGLEFVRGVPATSPVEEDGPAGLFEAVPPGGPIDRAAVQLREIVTGGREGGFFVMIGRRPGAEE